jgi:hypothetical protein
MGTGNHQNELVELASTIRVRAEARPLPTPTTDYSMWRGANSCTHNMYLVHNTHKTWFLLLFELQLSELSTNNNINNKAGYGFSIHLPYTSTD